MSLHYTVTLLTKIIGSLKSTGDWRFIVRLWNILDSIYTVYTVAQFVRLIQITKKKQVAQYLDFNHVYVYNFSVFSIHFISVC